MRKDRPEALWLPFFQKEQGMQKYMWSVVSALNVQRFKGPLERENNNLKNRSQ